MGSLQHIHYPEFIRHVINQLIFSFQRGEMAEWTKASDC
ncbi:hypothetical protein BVRB_5g110500 [Beta vulgaris subsp. vulgaris]|nr:hypothetical protein BVRB_5g110500 [Beta vulgaris subsp. vulgaris]